MICDYKAVLKSLIITTSSMTATTTPYCTLTVENLQS